MIATQFFFTLAFIAVVVSGIMVLFYFLCCGPDQKQFVLLVRVIAIISLVGGKYDKKNSPRHKLILIVPKSS